MFFSSGGEAGRERRSHDGDSDYVVAVFEILIFQSFTSIEDVQRGTVCPPPKETLSRYYVTQAQQKGRLLLSGVFLKIKEKH